MRLPLWEYVIVFCLIAFVGLIIGEIARISPVVAIVTILASLAGYYIYRKVK